MIETNETPDLASNGAGDSGASVQVARGSEQPQSGDPLLARMDDATTAPATTIITTSTTTTTATSSQASTLADTQGSSISSARTASTRSAASSKCSSAVIGGNLTTSSGSSLGSIKLAVERAPLDAGPALVAVRTSEIEPPAAASSDSLTLSSNEEFQSARIDLNEDFDDDDEDDVEDSHIMTNDETGNGRRRSDKRPNDKNVTKIEIGRNIEALQKSRSAQSSPLVTTTMRLQQQQQSAFQKQQRKQESHQNSPMTPHVLRSPHMLRSQTSPSPLNHLAGKLPPVMRAGGKLGSLNTGDSASQFSLQYKYQGSNHFEIRWQNVCLYARPSSRLPSFITDNSVYRTLFGDDSLSSSDPNETGNGMGLFNNGPRQPPYSPPLKHHQIPPTIDENLEMKCPNAEFEAVTNQRPIMAIADSSTSSNSSSSSIETTKQTQSQTPPPRAMTTTPVPPTPSPQPPSTAQSPGVRCVLNNISGQVFSGQMTAILGPSGVGKTSLLNSLTGRNTMDGTGRVSLIGANNSKRMSVVTVPQMDVLPSKLTTNEDLQFTSRLKNPQAKFDHQRNIDRLVKHLHMDKFLHTKIDKLSGGEARRLSIARELLNSPDIMILDEPTSGLDANTCKKIITALRDIVEHSDNILDKPMSIIITIHQPQQEVYQLFHRVYVMAVGGRVVYEGSPQLLMPTVLEYSSIGRIVPVEQLNENPAIVAIEVASGEYGSQVIEELAVHHEGQVYEEFTCFNGNGGGGGSLGGLESPMLTPRSLRMHKSPSSISRFDVQLHRKRLESAGDGSIGRPTPILAKRHLGSSQWDRMSAVTSVSYASTYDAELPEQTSKLKVDKRLRRSVVMKSHFVSHTITLIKRCWLLTMRDMFLMSIRILGFLLVAGGTVQIFSGALDPNEHQCPQFETDVDDIPSYLGQVQTRLVGLFEMLRQGNSTHLLFFHLLLCITMVTSALTGLVFPLQMRMFIREYKNGWYSPASFIMSQTIAELPADIVGPLLTLLITYPLCHQPDSIYHWRLAGYSVVVILASIICKSQAQIVGAFLMDSVENSVFISCVAVTPPALLSGVPLRIEQMILPLRLISYGSFLRYAFESLLELRYGFDMCPCDKSIIHGPLKVSLSAVPPHLESLATGLLELSLPPNSTTAAPLDELDKALSLSSNPATIGEGEHDNVFLKFLRLVTDASNMFTSNSEINDCDRYRSLYLINMGVKNNTLVSWLAVMVLMFIISRILTYFAVKTVIKLRRS